MCWFHDAECVMNFIAIPSRNAIYAHHKNVWPSTPYWNAIILFNLSPFFDQIVTLFIHCHSLRLRSIMMFAECTAHTHTQCVQCTLHIPDQSNIHEHTLYLIAHFICFLFGLHYAVYVLQWFSVFTMLEFIYKLISRTSLAICILFQI